MRRLIARCWSKTPHPELAELYRAEAKNPLEAFKLTQKLTSDYLDDTISRQILAEAALAAHMWGEARRHFQYLIEHSKATRQIYHSMAKLERSERNDDSAAMRWLGRVSDAPSDHAWHCGHCGSGYSDWQPVCTVCGTFDSVEWTDPLQSRTGLHSGSGSFFEAIEKPMLSISKIK